MHFCLYLCFLFKTVAWEAVARFLPMFGSLRHLRIDDAAGFNRGFIYSHIAIYIGWVLHSTIRRVQAAWGF
jgi:hypothetical protein